MRLPPLRSPLRTLCQVTDATWRGAAALSTVGPVRRSESGVVAPTEFASRDPLPRRGELRPALPEAVAARARRDVSGREGREGGREAADPDGRRAARPHPARSPRRAADRRAGDGRGRDRRRPGPLDHIAPGAPARDEAARLRPRLRRDGDDDGDVLQPAVARAPLPPRHAAAADRQVPGSARVPGQRARRDGRGRRGGGGHGDLPGLRGPVVGADRGARPRAPGDDARRARAAAGADPRAGAAPGPRRGARRRPLRRPGGRPPAARVRRAPAAADRAPAPPRAAPRGRAGRRARRRRAR